MVIWTRDKGQGGASRKEDSGELNESVLRLDQQGPESQREIQVAKKCTLMLLGSNPLRASLELGSFFFFLVFFCYFFWPFPRHMAVPRLGASSEL